MREEAGRARRLLRGVGRALASPPGALLLLGLTVLTTTCAGSYLAGSSPFAGWGGFADGLPFSLPLLLILGAHETGHWVAARLHRIPTTPPLFLPGLFGGWLFSPGTFGAFIRIRSPIPDRDALLDVGASGPLAGAVAAVPILLRGLALSEIVPVEGTEGGLRLGEPLLFKAVALAVLGPVPPGYDVALHPVALAAWFGLLVTMLNLLPAGQLDGGHVAYALFGPAWGRVARFLPAAAALLGLLWPGWFLWALLLLVLRTSHPPTLDDSLPLSEERRAVAWLALLLLALCFMPVPVTL